MGATHQGSGLRPCEKMRIRDLAVVAVRIFALWSLLNCVTLIEQVPIAYFSPVNSSDGFTRYLGFLNSFNFIFYLSLGVLLLYRTNAVAGFLAKGTDSEEPLRTSASDLAVLGFALIGMVTFIDGTEIAVQQIIVNYLRPELDMGVQVVRKEFELQIFTAGIVKVCIGILLLFSPAGIVKLLGWARAAGKERQAKA